MNAKWQNKHFYFQTRRLVNSTKVCAFAGCKSDGRTLPKNTNVHFIPFAKPCKVFTDQEISCIVRNCEDRNHNTKSCNQCSKAERWIRLSRRGDCHFQQLTDITKGTFVCSNHFAEGCSSENNPDPMPANATRLEIVINIFFLFSISEFLLIFL